MGLIDKIKNVKVLFSKAKKIIIMVFKMANKDLDIYELQRKFKADKEKTVEIYIRDAGYRQCFRLSGGKVVFVENPKKVDGTMETDTKTLLEIFSGEAIVKDTKTGKRKRINWTPMDAYRFGQIKITGEASTNDAWLFFNEVYEQLYPQLQKEFKSIVS